VQIRQVGRQPLNVISSSPSRQTSQQDADDRFMPGLKTAALGGAALLATPALALASPSTTGSAAAAAGLPSNLFWIGGAAAALGFLVGSVPKNDGWGFDGVKATVWATSAGLLAGGVSAALQGSLGLGLGAAGLGAVIGGAHFLAQERPTVSSIKMEPGVNRFSGESEKDQFKAASKAYYKASFESNGHYATRGRVEWEFNEKGADSAFVAALRDGCERPSSDTFAILSLLTRNLPAAEGNPAVVVVSGCDQLRQIQVDRDALRLPDGTEVPYKCVRAGVGYAWR